MTRKRKQRFKAWRFCKHLSRFVDCHRYPGFKLTQEIVEAELTRQEKGINNPITEPLRDAQRWKEVTLNGIIDECSEFRRNGWGWIYPIIAEFEHAANDWIMKKSILEIARNFQNDLILGLT